MDNHKPEVLFFAGPNGSGKSSFTRAFGTKGKYVNADDIKTVIGCSDLEAAQMAEKQRIDCVEQKEDFTFETVMSTERNLNLLKSAKERGYFVRGIYVVTSDPEINVMRVKIRVLNGGHDVPKEKIVSRYQKTIKILPEVVKVCDICNVYDNSGKKPVRIFKKRKDKFFYQEEKGWKKSTIAQLVGVDEALLQPISSQHSK